MTSDAFDWLQQSRGSAVSTKPKMLATAREEKAQPELVGWCDCSWLKKFCLQFLTKEYEVWPQGYSTYVTGGRGRGRRRKKRIKETGLSRIFYLKIAFLKIARRIACVRTDVWLAI